MLAKSITYTDYNGVTRTETFYFNLSKAEVSEMQLTHPGGYAEYLERIIETTDQAELVRAFKALILNSYGVKSEDGKKFRKSPEISKDFEESEAYSELFMEILNDADAASAFVNGIMPKVELTQEQQAELNERTRKLIESKTVIEGQQG